MANRNLLLTPDVSLASKLSRIKLELSKRLFMSDLEDLNFLFDFIDELRSTISMFSKDSESYQLGFDQASYFYQELYKTAKEYTEYSDIFIRLALLGEFSQLSQAKYEDNLYAKLKQVINQIKQKKLD